ncbi:MAG: hypothetical protein FWE18_05815 [Alphaproteobacteria bacterium]|nr:hypothetical protein [Alphaproteobacteria bacterium]
MRKIYTALIIGKTQTDLLSVYSTNQTVLCSDVIRGEEIKNNYKDMYEDLNMEAKDEFIVLQRYILDPARGY